MGFDRVCVIVLPAVLITVEREAAQSGGCFGRMLFRKGRLVSIIAFDCGTQSKVATFVEDLGVVIDVIAPPRCKRDEDQDDAFTHFRPFDDELPSVWRDDAPFVQVKHLCDAGVPAGLVSGFGIRTGEQRYCLPVVWGGLGDWFQRFKCKSCVADIQSGFTCKL